MDAITSLLSPSEIIHQNDPQFSTHSAPWALQADQKPSVVIAQSSIPALQKVVKALYDSSLDFAIRNTGTGGASASDVVLSMHNFKSFDFDTTPGDETVTVGAGMDWGEVEAAMEEKAAGYAVVGARCSWVGVTGSTLVGGFSWLSMEFGLMSDPQNTLDMQVVLGDGRVLWASEEPDLSWALRGGGGNFVVTALKLRARPYPHRPFNAVLFYPYSSLAEVSKVVSKVASRPADPRIGFHLCSQGPGLGTEDQGSRPGLGLVLFDARGAEHARSEAGFAWAWQISGVHEIVSGELSLRDMHKSAESYRSYNGVNYFWASAPLVEKLDENFVVRFWKWLEESIDRHPEFSGGSAILLEYMGANAFNSSASRSATGWPHSGSRHVVQTVLGCRPQTAPANISDIAHEQLMKLEPEVAGPDGVGEYHVGFLHPWNDLREVFGENLDKLQEVKERYDAKNRFNKGVNLAGAKKDEESAPQTW